MDQKKSSAAPIIIGLVALLVIAGGVFAYTQNKEAMMKGEEVMEKTDAMMASSSDTMMKDESAASGDAMMKGDAMMAKGSYQAYSPEKIALAAKGHVVLFFRASWCPTCRALDADIKANLSSIPDGVTILDVDYDKSTELKQKYGVTTQHTLVEVDAFGKLIHKWTGSPTLTSVVAGIK